MGAWRPQPQRPGLPPTCKDERAPQGCIVGPELVIDGLVQPVVQQHQLHAPVVHAGQLRAVVGGERGVVGFGRRHLPRACALGDGVGLRWTCDIVLRG